MKILPIFLFLFSTLLQTISHAGSWAEDGEAFLQSNKERPRVVTLKSGLQYKILIEGHGPKPGKYSNVAVYYSGKLHDGTEFDAASITKPPIVLNVNRVIQGWKEALPLMSVGSMWELYIPAKLAYGHRGSGKSVPADSVLIFEIELVDIR